MRRSTKKLSLLVAIAVVRWVTLGWVMTRQPPPGTLAAS